ncbi:MAG: hypothetical protein RL367_1360 [Pseudomonadota bacterium]|jgi:hypothetical protein
MVCDMNNPPLTVDRATADLAAEMIALFGDDAAGQAALRASSSRDAGNAVRFCRWRLAGRLIDLLADDQLVHTLH